MKRATLTISIKLDISYQDAFDDDWICEQYLSSPRCSINELEGEIGFHAFSSAGVDLVRGSDVATPALTRTATASWWTRLARWLSR
jgi:hypothetical protein